jgi:hypothetical protein
MATLLAIQFNVYLTAPLSLILIVNQPQLSHFAHCYNRYNSQPADRQRMQITIEVPDLIGEQLQQLGDRLPEALDRALQELTSTETAEYQDDHQIVELLASQPNPEVVLAIRPSPALQARMSELLAQNKSGTLTKSEEVELDRYMLLEHWVRLAKAHAYSRDRNKDARAATSDRRFLKNDIDANKTIESSAIDFNRITFRI